MPERAGVVVVGAGPAGSTLAATLARGGGDVVLVERDRFPRDKLCGEVLSGEARGTLERLGCLDQLLGLGPARLARARFVSPAGAALDLALPEGALGVSRRVLDALLVARARAAGARVLEATEAEAIEARAEGPRVALRDRATGLASALEASLVVLAHGRRSRLDRQLGIPPPRRGASWVGVKRHLRPLEGGAGRVAREGLAASVEVHGLGSGYCGLSPVEGGLVNACMLLRPELAHGLGGGSWQGLVERLGNLAPRLGARLGALEPAEPGVHVVAGIRVDEQGRGGGSVLRAGDAAGTIAPLAGDGQAMALRSGALLGELILATGPAPGAAGRERLARRWEELWVREFRTRMRVARLVHRLMLWGPGMELGVRLVGALPPLGRLLVAGTRGHEARLGC